MQRDDENRNNKIIVIIIKVNNSQNIFKRILPFGSQVITEEDQAPPVWHSAKTVRAGREANKTLEWSDVLIVHHDHHPEYHDLWDGLGFAAPANAECCVRPPFLSNDHIGAGLKICPERKMSLTLIPWRRLTSQNPGSRSWKRSVVQEYPRYHRMNRTGRLLFPWCFNDRSPFTSSLVVWLPQWQVSSNAVRFCQNPETDMSSKRRCLL